MFVGTLFDEVTADHQDFLRMAWVEFGAGPDTPSCAGLHGDRVPRFAGAKSVKVSGLEVCHHLRWGDDHNANVQIRVDSRPREPSPEQVTV